VSYRLGDDSGEVSGQGWVFAPALQRVFDARAVVGATTVHEQIRHQLE
jgi:hypothetical protein